MSASGRNIEFAIAWQGEFGVSADAAANAWTFNTNPGSIGPTGVQAPEDRTLMGLDGDVADPAQGPHDVSGSWDLPLCARQAGFWLRGLFGEAAATDVVGSRGGFLFKTQPVAGDQLTVGATALSFVAGAPGANEIQIGGTLLETVDNAVTVISALADLSATDKGQILFIEHGTADATGDAVVTQSSAANRILPFAATLKGGGYTRYRFEDTANLDRPWASIEVEHKDLNGSAYQYRLVDSHMIRSIAFPKNRAGQANMTVEALARQDARSANRSLRADPAALDVMAFSYLGGSVLFDGTCIGTIDSAGITMGIDLTADGFDACSIGDVAVIGQPIVGDASAGLDLVARFPTEVLMDAAFQGTPVSCELFYVNRATGAVLSLHLPRVFLARPTEQTAGRSAITASFTGIGYKDQTLGYRYQAMLYSPVGALT